jgi:putative transposase
VQELAAKIGVKAACQAFGLPRSSYYRTLQKKPTPTRRRPHRALSQAEREQVRTLLNSERFQDKTPREVYAALLDEGQYLCHWRTMYRILKEHNEVRERRNQVRRPAYHKHELLATRPNELWSWDITKLLGPSKWTYFYLYVILDVYSRYVVGWMVSVQEAAHLAEKLVSETCQKQNIRPEQLTLHADRGAAMQSKRLALLLADLGVTKTHSRPHVSNDNPYSEAHFKTLKYRPDYPKRFETLEKAQEWSRTFFDWYNYCHYHSGIGLLVPASVHYGRAPQQIEQRNQVLQLAYEKNPERFVHGQPQHPVLPEGVWINKPKQDCSLSNGP